MLPALLVVPALRADYFDSERLVIHAKVTVGPDSKPDHLPSTSAAKDVTVIKKKAIAMVRFMPCFLQSSAT